MIWVRLWWWGTKRGFPHTQQGLPVWVIIIRETEINGFKVGPHLIGPRQPIPAGKNRRIIGINFLVKARMVDFMHVRCDKQPTEERIKPSQRDIRMMKLRGEIDQKPVQDDLPGLQPQ